MMLQRICRGVSIIKPGHRTEVSLSVKTYINEDLQY